MSKAKGDELNSPGRSRKEMHFEALDIFMQQSIKKGIVLYFKKVSVASAKDSIVHSKVFFPVYYTYS